MGLRLTFHAPTTRFQEKEIGDMWLNQENMFWIDGAKIPGYYRKAFRTSTIGFMVKNVSTICHFNLVLFQNKKDNKDILVELRYGKGRKIDKPIDPKWMHGFVKDTNWEDLFVEIDGRSYFKGQNLDNENSPRPSMVTCQCTNAYAFLHDCGKDLAAALAFQDKITTLYEAGRLLWLLESVRKYVVAQSDDSHGDAVKLWKTKIGDCIDSIADLESSRRKNLEGLNKGIETLRRFGIEYEIEQG